MVYNKRKGINQLINYIFLVIDNKIYTMITKCNLCNSFIIRINKTILGTRCMACKSTQIHRAVGLTISNLNINKKAHVYELSSRGALHKYLKRNYINLYYSEFFDDIPSGEYYNGILCQNVQNLTFNNNMFDLVTSTEVFEHVPNDILGFSEVFRVLKNGGIFLFTVPYNPNDKTIERVKIDKNGNYIHLLPPEYHGDRIRGARNVLAFRNYGYDIKERLEKIGFSFEIKKINSKKNSINSQHVILAKKP